MTERNEKKEEMISLLDIVLVLAKHKKLIFFATIIAGIVIVLISVLSIILPADSFFNFFPNVYKPEVTVLLKLPGEGGSGFSSLLSGNSELGSLVGLIGGGSVSGGSGIADLTNVLLKSNLIRDKIIDDFNFIERYKIEKKIKTNSRKIFDESISLTVDNASNTIKIGYEFTEPEFATKVVNNVVLELEKIVKELYLNKSSKKKEFLEERIQLQEEEYKKAQNEIISFQKMYGIINVDTQIEASIEFISTLQAEIYSKELELKNLKENYAYNQVKIELLEADISRTKTLINELQTGFREFSNEFIPQDMIPELAARFLNLKQDLTLKAAIYQMLKEQYEAVKIEESDNSETFNVLEWAEVPETKDSPRRSIIVIIVVFTAFIISVFIAFIKEYIRSIKNDPEESKKLLKIKEEIKIKFKK